MTHYIEKCECGKTMGQCRCPDNNKTVRLVSPCTHGETGALIETDNGPVEVELGVYI